MTCAKPPPRARGRDFLELVFFSGGDGKETTVEKPRQKKHGKSKTKIVFLKPKQRPNPKGVCIAWYSQKVRTPGTSEFNRIVKGPRHDRLMS